MVLRMDTMRLVFGALLLLAVGCSAPEPANLPFGSNFACIGDDDCPSGQECLELSTGEFQCLKPCASASVCRNTVDDGHSEGQLAECYGLDGAGNLVPEESGYCFMVCLGSGCNNLGACDEIPLADGAELPLDGLGFCSVASSE